MWQVRDLRERNLRVLADMENLRERSAKAAQSTKQYAIQARHWGGTFTAVFKHHFGSVDWSSYYEHFTKGVGSVHRHHAVCSVLHSVLSP